MERYKYLSGWLGKTLKDKPEILETKDPNIFYHNLYEVWLEDVQKALKESLQDVKNV